MANKIGVEVEFRGIEIGVKGKHIPEEPAIPYDSDMGGHPGYPEYFDIEALYIENTDVSYLLEEHYEEIAKLVIEKLNNE